MQKYVVAITLDKVQNFLYQTFKTNTVEAQKEANTLQHVIQASNELSERMPKKIKKVFKERGCSIKEADEIVKTSGKYIFYTKLSSSKIEDCLKELFQYYYLREIKQGEGKENLKSKGQMRLDYMYFDLNSEKAKKLEQKYKICSQLESEMRAIKIVNAHFKSGETISRVIEDNQSVLFDFPNKENIESIDPLPIDSNLLDGVFINNIDALKKELDNSDSKENDFFRMAVVKADLDGMGDLLKSMVKYEHYKLVSNILNQYISITYFHDLMKRQKDRKRDNKSHTYFKLLPLYVAGDDIFFLTNVKHIFDVIDILGRWLKEINEALNGHTELSLSVGIDIVAHSLPLRYIYEQVEEQLENAKNYKSDTGNVKINISIYNQIFHIFKATKTQLLADDSKEVKKKKERLIKDEIELLKRELRIEGKNFDDGWNKFKREVALMQTLNNEEANDRSKEVGFSYLYNLLEKSTMPQVKNNSRKYINVLLDQLLPDLEEKTKNNQVKNVLLNQLLFEYDPDDKFKERKLVFDKARYREKFERKLRLFLLFTSERYKVIIQANPESERELKSSLILKPARHLYENLSKLGLAGHKKDQIGLFIQYAQSPKRDKKGKVEKDRKSKIIQTDYYRRVPIKTSMFHKLKKFEKKGLLTESSDAIFNVSNSLLEVKKEKQTDLQASKSDREYDKVFKKDQFIELAKNKEKWNEDVIDSLMILYKYIDVLQYWSEQE
jgi:hypothetical protein